MGKKMKLPFLYKAMETPSSPSSASSWPWVTCRNPKTLSFRAASLDVLKTMNSAYGNSASESESFSSTATEAIDEESESIERVIKGLRSERLFFEPGQTSAILKAAKSDDDDESMFKQSVVMAMDSTDPFQDFGKSMEEMVEAHGLKDWDCLEELLTCYLKVNAKSNHGYIVGAFVDLLVRLSFAASSASKSSGNDPCCSSSTTHDDSFTSPLSFYSSTSSASTPCLSSLEAGDEIEKSVDNASSSSFL